MKIFKEKKAYIQHPGAAILSWSIIAFLVGMVVMYLISQGVIPFFMDICRCTY